MKRLLSIFVLALYGTLSWASEDLFIGELTSGTSGLTYTNRTFMFGAPASTQFSPAEPFTVDIKALQDGFVDIVYKFSEECFIDHVSLDVGGRYGASYIQILTPSQAVSPETPLAHGENSLVVAWKSDTFILRLYKKVGALETVSIEVLRDDYENFTVSNVRFYGATGLENAFLPLPKKITYSEGKLPVTGVSAPKQLALAADNFREKYGELCSKTLPSKGNVSFSLDKTMEKEAFKVTVTPQEATVCGGSVRALLYGSERLLRLLDTDGSLKCAEIDDAPFFPVRGVHIAITERKNFEFLRRMVKYVFMPMGYNTVFLQFAGNMEYKKHPEINDAWVRACTLFEEGKGPSPAHYGFVGRDIISQKEVKELCAYLRSYGLDIIPEIQTFGHTQYITMAHPELAEKVEVKASAHDQLVEDARPDVTYYHTCCPNAEGYFPLVFDIIDEVCAVVKPDGYVHIGHDEIYELGKCPKCQAEGAANVYAREVTTLHDYLAGKGLGTMMWSDMITRTQYASSAAIGRLPKDIVCLPFTWYFYLRQNIDSEKPLVDNGYRYLIGNMYSSHFPRFDERKHNPGMLGGEVSTWQICDERHFGYRGKIYDFLYSAQLLWNGDKDYGTYRRCLNELVRQEMPSLRSFLHYGSPLEKMEEVALPIGSTDVPYDLANSFSNGIAASKGSDAVIPVGMKAEKICLTNAADIAVEKSVELRSFPAPFAKYIIEYEDGSASESPIYYGYQIGPYKWPWGAPRLSSTFRHFGYSYTYPSKPTCLKTIAGEDATVWEYAIDNPEPQKTVKNIRVCTDGAGGAKIYIFKATALN